MQISKFPLIFCALGLCIGLNIRAEDTPAQAAARAAMIQKMQELQGGSAPAAQNPAPAQAAPTEAAAPVVATPTPAAAAPAATTVAPAETPAATAPAASTAAAVNQSGDSAAQAAARAALDAKMAELGTLVTPAPAVVAQGKTPTARTAAEMGTPIVAPALPISMTKEQKLAELLSQYKADRISPEQYHEQRAAILAEPQ
jgi:hypothetical protein